MTPGERPRPIRWRLVQREHVLRACELIVSGKLAGSTRSRGLFVVVGDNRLPAKAVARAAYLLAAGKSADAHLEFASGQSTLEMFKRLGFEVERQQARKEG